MRKPDPHIQFTIVITSFLAVGLIWLAFIAALKFIHKPSPYWDTTNNVQMIKNGLIAYYQDSNNWNKDARLRSQAPNPDYINTIFFHNSNNYKYVEGTNTLYDQWGVPLLIMIDHNLDGIINMNGEEISKKAIVWSSGENKIDEFGEGDDIRSW